MGSVLIQLFLFTFGKHFTVYKGLSFLPRDIPQSGVLFSEVGDIEVEVPEGTVCLRAHESLKEWGISPDSGSAPAASTDVLRLGGLTT